MVTIPLYPIEHNKLEQKSGEPGAFKVQLQNNTTAHMSFSNRHAK